MAAVKLTAVLCLWTAPESDQPPIFQPVIIRTAIAADAAQDAANQTANASSEANNATQPSPTESQDLISRERELDRRETELRALEHELDDKLEQLQALERKMQNLIDSASTIQDDKMRHLVDVYSNMKPKQAAQVLETLEESIAVRILAGMSGRKAGEILSSVRADKAAQLSEALTRLQTGENGK